MVFKRPREERNKPERKKRVMGRMILDVFNSDADELFLLCVDKERAHPVALW